MTGDRMDSSRNALDGTLGWFEFVATASSPCRQSYRCAFMGELKLTHYPRTS
jgi:hypothetical protein